MDCLVKFEGKHAKFNTMESYHTKPNPSVCWMAFKSFSFIMFLVEYFGRSRRLKQVWATGKKDSAMFIG